MSSNSIVDPNPPDAGGDLINPLSASDVGNVIAPDYKQFMPTVSEIPINADDLPVGNVSTHGLLGTTGLRYKNRLIGTDGVQIPDNQSITLKEKAVYDIKLAVTNKGIAVKGISKSSATGGSINTFAGALVDDPNHTLNMVIGDGKNNIKAIADSMKSGKSFEDSQKELEHKFTSSQGYVLKKQTKYAEAEAALAKAEAEAAAKAAAAKAPAAAAGKNFFGTFRSPWASSAAPAKTGADTGADTEEDAVAASEAEAARVNAEAARVNADSVFNPNGTGGSKKNRKTSKRRGGKKSNKSTKVNRKSTRLSKRRRG